jgi:hypothetical protein
MKKVLESIIILFISIGSIFLFCNFNNQTINNKIAVLVAIIVSLSYSNLPKGINSKMHLILQIIVTIFISLFCYWLFITFI